MTDILRLIQELNERHTEPYTHQWALTWSSQYNPPFWEIVDISDLQTADSAFGDTPDEAYQNLLQKFYPEGLE